MPGCDILPSDQFQITRKSNFFRKTEKFSKFFLIIETIGLISILLRKLISKNNHRKYRMFFEKFSANKIRLTTSYLARLFIAAENIESIVAIAVKDSQPNSLIKQ